MNHAAARLPAWEKELSREAVLLAIHAHMSGTSLAYHQIVISLNVMISTVTVFSTGYLLTAVAGGGVMLHAALATILLLSGIAIAVTWVVRAHSRDLAAVIRRLDDALGLFNVGRYLAGAKPLPRRP